MSSIDPKSTQTLKEENDIKIDSKDKESTDSIVSSEKVSDYWNKDLGVWASMDDNNQLQSYMNLLTNIDKLYILRQYKVYNEDSGNRYLLKDKNGKNLLYGIERNCGSGKICICGENRSFTMTLYDKNHSPTLYFYRPFRYGCCGLIPCCGQKIVVKNKLKEIIGEVKETMNLFGFSLIIKLPLNERKLEINGQKCKITLICFLDDICFNIYDITTKERRKIGHICKKSELSSCGHVFSIDLISPIDLSADLKSALIGATILIDYYYFEHTFHEQKYHTMSSSQSMPAFPLINRYENNE